MADLATIGTKSDIIARLKKEILLLNGFKKALNNVDKVGLPLPVKNAFPEGQFPLGAIHEFLIEGSEEAAATAGFVSGMLASLMRNSGVTIWISACRNIFPPSLISFGIIPEKIIFIDLKKEKEILWAMEEALKCNSVAAVVGELHELTFTASRRLQLAVEQSRVTGFILRQTKGNINTTACLSRWKITSSPSVLEDEMPGVGFPRWNVELLKVRNGKPGKWELEFADGRFRNIPKIAAIIHQPAKKTG
ncbi:MAG: Error-prone repair protein ImuA [Ginsengibacter sp.]